MVPAFALVSRTGGGTSLAVPVLDYAPVLADTGLHRFTSREWLIAMIEDAVTMDSVPDVPRTGRYVLIGAGAGLGKTTLASTPHPWRMLCFRPPQQRYCASSE